MPKKKEELLEEQDDLQEEEIDEEGQEHDEEAEKEENEEAAEGDPQEDEGEEGAEGQEDGDAAFEANFKYNIHGQEFEFDDLFKEVIKDKDSEDKIRDLHTKAHGLDEAKESREKWRKNFEEKEGEYSQLMDYTQKTVFKSKELYEKGHKVEAILNLFSPQDVIEVANYIDSYNNADEQNKKLMDNNVQNNLKVYDDAHTMTNTEKLLQEQMARNTQMELNMAINYDQENKKIADWWDSIYGAGEFKKEVDNHAAREYAVATQNGQKPLSPTDYVRQTREKLSKLLNKRPTSQSGSSADAITKNVNNTSRKDRIPTAKSKGSVVGKAKFSKLPPEKQTFEEMRKRIKEEELLEDEE